jgi:HD-GYP domain-containing protein (c-di-GMP phosphodiesterase class II)
MAAKWEDTKAAKKKMQEMSTQIAQKLGFDAPKTRVAPSRKGSVAKTFDVNKIREPQTPQDAAMAKIIKKKYGW